MTCAGAARTFDFTALGTTSLSIIHILLIGPVSSSYLTKGARDCLLMDSCVSKYFSQRRDRKKEHTVSPCKDKY